MLDGETRIRAAVLLEHNLRAAMRSQLPNKVRTVIRHMSARIPGTSQIRCPACEVPWPCLATITLADVFLDIEDVEEHLQTLARSETRRSPF
jgi:hypothetical protein